MNCAQCGTELFAGSLFCGECGRAVTAPRGVSAPAASVAAAPTAPLAPQAAYPVPRSAPELASEPAPELVEVVQSCLQCGAALEASDIFCPECGFVCIPMRSRPGDTVAIEPLIYSAPGLADPPPPAVAELTPPTAVELTPPTAVELTPPTVVELTPPTAVEPGPPAIVEPGPPAVAEPAAPAAAQPTADAAAGIEFAAELGDLEKTRIVSARGPHRERFVLHFSTGESASVSGTGLVGRNPIAEPGEYVDSIVTISDPGKSVSKTHLEFGQEGGAFWINDRFSANGTIVREPDREPRRCDPGKRYRISRGTRVDIGEQFFVVS